MNQPTTRSATTTNGTANPTAGAGVNRPGLARKSNPCDLLKNLKSVDKKQQKKPTILEQATQDWQKCKIEENLEDELKQATKSKGGYLERQNFLQRSDVRVFEKEREIRDRVRSRAPLPK